MNNCSPSLADIYNFLAMAAQYPEAHSWTQQFWRQYLLLITEIESAAEIALIKEFAGGQGWLAQLQAEHTRLFINAYPHVVAPACGSYYMVDEALAVGPYLAQLADYYQKKGVQRRETGPMVDQLAVQLEFLAHLERADDQEGVAEFLTKFFRPWFGLFRDRVLAHAQLPFYPSLVRVIDFFTQ